MSKEDHPFLNIYIYIYICVFLYIRTSYYILLYVGLHVHPSVPSIRMSAERSIDQVHVRTCGVRRRGNKTTESERNTIGIARFYISIIPFVFILLFFFFIIVIIIIFSYIVLLIPILLVIIMYRAARSFSYVRCTSVRRSLVWAKKKYNT